MNHGLALDRVGCARNSGVFILTRILLGSFIFLSLNTLFYVPVEGMLAAVQSVKANVLFFILIICALVPLAFISLVVSFPLNNVLSSVNKDLSIWAARLRGIEALIFIAGMVLLIVEIPLFYQVFLSGLILYGLHLIIVGYLVFKSGFLSNVLGISLIIGGSVGYFFGGITGFFVPSLVLLSTIGIVFAIITEISLAFVLIVTASRTTFDDDDSKSRVIKILKDLGEATTTEIIVEASKESLECKDRVPRTLKALEIDNEVTKRLSKEKKGYVWTLVG
ncbi:MAG: DUF4386 domain-containing protein [Candidatus Thorarchaeota archaeon]|nr:DUF4386 domain-containing protein [Candidatus Thorarchaeota archaeon]